MVKKVCGILSTIVFLFLFVIAGLLFVPKFLGYSQYAVLSGSMEPDIHVGAIVYNKDFSEDAIEEGTVITYQLSEKTLITHRIVSIDRESRTVITQGDANDSTDMSPVSFDQIVGVYAFSIPFLGYITMYAKTPLGITAICVVLIVIILLNFIPDIIDENEKEKKEKESINEKKEEK